MMQRWCLKIFILLMLTLVACTNQTQRSNFRGNRNQKDSDDPYTQFTRSINLLESQSENFEVDAQIRGNQKSNGENEVKLPLVKPLEVEGNIIIAGSSEIEPLNKLIYERFIQQGYAGVIDLNGIGSTAAIKLFCEQQDYDLVTITRALREDEIAACRAKGHQPIGFQIGKDALMIVVSRQDSFVKQVTRANLAAMLTVEKWSNVNPNWPERPIERILSSPSVALDIVLEKAFAGNSQLSINPLNTKYYKDYESIIQNLSNTRYRVGMLSYSAYQPVSRSLRAIALDGVAASPKAIENGTYPLSQTLFIYTDVNRIKQKPQVSAFINFYLTYVNEEIKKTGLLPIAQKELNQSKIKWLKVMGLKAQLSNE
ncbi:MAG: substrate-binding domain-containing protein [Cyanobacteria bacterium J06633_8]